MNENQEIQFLDALNEQDLKKVKQLMEEEIDWNVHLTRYKANSCWDTPLAVVMFRYDNPTDKILLEIFRLLLESGANPNYATGDGTHLLYLACYNLDVEFVDLLLEFGAKPNEAMKNSGSEHQSIIDVVEEELKEFSERKNNEKAEKMALVLLKHRDRFLQEEQQKVNVMRMNHLFI